ncbi:UDP-glucose 4-epimerase GalE [Vandammella animalimorsus]|uniref:UDP-glucose 4-epimerase n=1 Tax=Vandammella animalimorsus TaxID=2029117 RepID=A0A2A2T3S2_9BURK|nr:UDP-glucose 4-epimerase GalE [Vandammella animalimorsus]PAT31196.1 UDP-glucose 4-epimerase GalE [Vandammella animalimorsus]PAX16159.1 UDP-glucose 4-epimerase GalE [Vandammella animalimorsus]PAX18189.1 UDP-glucose 4-epimerase GalE [Vandammella animalimorsus]
MPTSASAHKILVVGGAGYIGSHMVKHLCRQGLAPVVLDDLSAGYADAVVAGAELVVGSAADAGLLTRLFAQHRFDAVMHFASFIQVGESVIEPAKYYANNVAATLTLLQAMRAAGVPRFIFSSTAAVYGDPQQALIDEDHPKQPINPYGRSKWMAEQMLEDFDRAYGLKSVCLRYFNAAGADPEGELGERHVPETHLIPLVLQAAAGRRAAIAVFGTDYDTPDGSCIRDYIHIADLCQAHALALQHLLAGGPSLRLNLGNGQGFSVLEVIEAARQVTGRDITVRLEPRRPGDPARLVADSRLARKLLGWQPRHADLRTIIAHAWAWEQAHRWP